MKDEERTLTGGSETDGGLASQRGGLCKCGLGCCALVVFSLVVVPLMWQGLTSFTADFQPIRNRLLDPGKHNSTLIASCPDFVCTECCKGDAFEQMMQCNHEWILTSFKLGPWWNPVTWLLAPATMLNYIFKEEQVTVYDPSREKANQAFDIPVNSLEKAVVQANKTFFTLQRDEGYFQTYELDEISGVIRKVLFRYGNTIDMLLVPLNDTNANDMDCYVRSLGLSPIAMFFLGLADIPVALFKQSQR